MHKLVILIPEFEDNEVFDAGWPQFLKWAEQMPGLRREVTSRTVVPLYGAQAFQMMHELIFDSLESVQVALGSQFGTAAGQTLQEITQGNVTLFIAEHLEDSLENIQEAQKGRP
jgi:uncharacterized protein (TIGR02118 family)